MPPDARLGAKAGGEGGLKHPVQHHSRQRIAFLASGKTRSGGLGPDLKKLFGRDLIGHVPVCKAEGRSVGQDVEADFDIFLELHALPVLNELLGAALDLERRVVVLDIWVKERCKHCRIALLPRILVPLHELFDVHDLDLSVVCVKTPDVFLS